MLTPVGLPIEKAFSHAWGTERQTCNVLCVVWRLSTVIISRSTFSSDLFWCTQTVCLNRTMSIVLFCCFIELSEYRGQQHMFDRQTRCCLALPHGLLDAGRLPFNYNFALWTEERSRLLLAPFFALFFPDERDINLVL